MIAVSTSWCSKGLKTPEELLKRLERLNIRALELEYRINDIFYRDLRPVLRSSGIQVVSVHNYFPYPIVLDRTVRPGGDMFLLSSPDREQRREAVERTVHTIENAHELECGNVVIHCGKVEMESGFERIRRHWEDGTFGEEALQAYLQMKIEERNHKIGPYLDALCFSLDRLIETALRENVRLGLENRYHYHELPGIEEFEILFREFKGAPIGYWHDTGHAYAGEIMSMAEPGELLRKFGNHLAGIHFHDAKGFEDHLAPGKGEIDFSSLGSSIEMDIPLVMELKPDTSDKDVGDGLRFLEENLFTKAAKPSEKPETGSLIFPDSVL